MHSMHNAYTKHIPPKFAIETLVKCVGITFLVHHAVPHTLA